MSADRRVDVAWYGDVDDEQGAASAMRLRRFEIGARDDGSRRSRRRHDDVGRAEPSSIPSQGTASHPLRPERLGVRPRPAGDDDGADALASQVLCGERADLAGADDQHPAPLETAEDLPCERHCGEAHRHCAFTERRLGANAFADAERPVEQCRSSRPRAVLVGRRLERVLHLSENLRLADDERIEPGGDAEQMRDRGAVLEREDVRLEDVGGHVMVSAQKGHQFVTARAGSSLAT